MVPLKHTFPCVPVEVNFVCVVPVFNAVKIVFMVQFVSQPQIYLTVASSSQLVHKNAKGSLVKSLTKIQMFINNLVILEIQRLGSCRCQKSKTAQGL